MPKILDRADLVSLVASKAPLPAIRRACIIGQVELLGGFQPLPPISSPGWILTVRTKSGREHHVAVVPDNLTHDYHVQLIEYVPWEKWIGSNLVDQDYNIRFGDFPLTYFKLKEEALGRNA